MCIHRYIQTHAYTHTHKHTHKCTHEYNHDYIQCINTCTYIYIFAYTTFDYITGRGADGIHTKQPEHFEGVEFVTQLSKGKISVMSRSLSGDRRLLVYTSSTEGSDPR